LLKPGLAEYAAQADTMEMPAFAKSQHPERPAGTK
jgi:hypothetical protein